MYPSVAKYGWAAKPEPLFWKENTTI